MFLVFIKYFTIVFWSLFVFRKSINQKQTAKIIIFQMFYSVALSFAVALTVKSFLPEAIFIFIIILSCIFNKFITKRKWNITIVASVIAFGCSYVLRTLSSIVVSIIFGVIFVSEEFKESTTLLFLIFTFVFAVSGLFVFLLFRNRRLKNGFPFLNDKHISLLGVIIALIVFQCYYVYSVVIEMSGGVPNSLALFLLLCVAVCAALIIIWWRTGITKNYRDKLAEKENKELYLELSEKNERIAEIEKDNTDLSKIIHSDNKLIPALKNAVMALREEYSEELAGNIFAELERVSAERKGILNQYKKESKRLPSTRITSLDLTLDYMKQKSYENNIEFDVMVNGSIKHMVENFIEEEQLRKIIADLLENAIIAVKPCKTRNILFTIGICDDCYEIRINDSGIDFDEETLRDLGKKQTTTHKDEGGSGIGMIEIFDVMGKTGASLIIKQLSESGQGFTKRVSIRFDGKCKYVCDYKSTSTYNSTE